MGSEEVSIEVASGAVSEVGPEGLEVAEGVVTEMAVASGTEVQMVCPLMVRRWVQEVASGTGIEVQVGMEEDTTTSAVVEAAQGMPTSNLCHLEEAEVGDSTVEIATEIQVGMEVEGRRDPTRAEVGMMSRGAEGGTRFGKASH